MRYLWKVLAILFTVNVEYVLVGIVVYFAACSYWTEVADKSYAHYECVDSIFDLSFL